MVSERLYRNTLRSTKNGWPSFVELRVIWSQLKCQNKGKATISLLAFSYQVKKFPVHVVIGILGIVNEVFGSGEPIFIQQLTAILPYLVRLTSAFLFETFDMAIINLRESKIFIAVSEHGIVCSHSVSAPTYLTFALMISDC